MATASSAERDPAANSSRRLAGRDRRGADRGPGEPPDERSFADRLADVSSTEVDRKLVRQLRHQIGADEPAAPLTTDPREQLALTMLRNSGFTGTREAGLPVVRELLDLEVLTAEAGDDLDAFEDALDGAIEALATGFMAPMFTGPGSPNISRPQPRPQAGRRRRTAPADRERSAPRRREQSKRPELMTTRELQEHARRPSDPGADKRVSDKLRQQGGIPSGRPPRAKPWHQQEMDSKDPEAVATRRMSRRLLGLSPEGGK